MPTGEQRLGRGQQVGRAPKKRAPRVRVLVQGLGTPRTALVRAPKTVRIRVRQGAAGTAMPAAQKLTSQAQHEALQGLAHERTQAAKALGVDHLPQALWPVKVDGVWRPVDSMGVPQGTPGGFSVGHLLGELAKTGVRAGINLDKTIYDAKFGAPDKRLGASLDLANDATGYRQVEQIRQHPVSGSIALASLLPGGRLLRGAGEFGKAALAAEEGERLGEGARAGVESYKAGKGVVGPAAKLIGKRARVVVRKAKVGAAELETPAAASRSGRAVEALARKARETIGTKPTRRGSLTGRLANLIGSSPEKQLGKQLGRQLETRTRTMGAAAQRLRRVGAKLTQEQEYALRILGEQGRPGSVSVEARRAFHASRIATAPDEQQALAHAIHADLIEKAKPYLVEHADGSIELAKDAPKALRESWRLLQKTAKGREDIYRELGLLHDEQIAERVAAPGRVVAGAKYVEPTPGKLGLETPGLKAARARVASLSGRLERVRAEQEAAEYRGFHVAPEAEPGASMDNPHLMFPDDLYGPRGAEIYGQGARSMDEPVVDLFRSVRGRPDAKVTVYRAVPKDAKAIGAGDWVTPSREYAQLHADSNLRGRFKILSREVRAGDLYTEGNSLHEFGWRPASTAQRQNNLTGALAVAKEDLTRAESAAARRVEPTGLVGAEGVAEGNVYTSYVRALPRPAKADGALVGAYWEKVAAFSAGSGRAIGAGPRDQALAKSFKGQLLESGLFDPEVTKAAADKMMIAVRVSNAHLARELLLGASHEVPKSAFDIAIKVDPAKDAPQSLRALSDRMKSARQAPLTAEELDSVDWNLAEALRQDIFPAELEGHPVGEVAKSVLESGKPISNIRWISPDLLESSGLLTVPKASQSLGTEIVKKAADTLNSATKAGVIYLRPAYMPVNLLGNLAMNVLQQGVFLPRNLLRASMLHSELLPEERYALDHLMGSGLSGAVGLNPAAGLGKLADWMGVVVDRVPRRGAFLHEAGKLGYTDNAAIRDLLGRGMDGDEAALKDLELIRTKAADAIVDYERLSPFERNVVSRVLFVYPWTKGASRYAMRYAVDHPVVSVALALMADNAVDNANGELGPRPYYEEWSIPLSTKSLGLHVPGTDLGVDLSQAVGEHELRDAEGRPEVFNPSQVFTQETPIQLAGDIAGTLTGRTEQYGDVSQDINPLLGEGADWLAGYDPETHEEIPHSLASVGHLAAENVSAWQTVQRINSADPHDAGKLLPRSRKQVIEQAFLSGLAPAPYNTTEGQKLAAGIPKAPTPMEKENHWIVSTQKAIGEKLPHEIVVAAHAKATYEEMEKAAAKKTATGRLTEYQRGDLLLEVLIRTYPEFQQYAGELWKGIRQDPTASQRWIEDKLGWQVIERLDEAVNKVRRAKRAS